MEFVQTDYLPTGYLVNIKGDILGRQGKILKPTTSNSGYQCIVAGKKGKFIHRAIAFAFIPLVEGKNYVNHIDGNKSNNSVDNLEWCTNSENQIHAYKLGLKETPPNWAKGNFGKQHNRSKEILSLDKNRLPLKKYGSISEASRELGVIVSSIHYSANNKSFNKKAKVFFEYTHEENWNFSLTK